MAEPQVKAEPKVIARVRATKEGGFYRAGRHWPKSWTDIKDGELTESQFEALVDEPMLVVEGVRQDEAPAEPPKEKAQAPAEPPKDKAPAPAKEPDKAKAEEKAQAGKGK